MFHFTALHLILAHVLFGSALAHGVNEFCDDDMSACTCPEEYDVCPFELVIKRMITFTRYEKDAPTGTRGKIYFINDQGELEHNPFPPNVPGCSAENSCTPANTVDGETFRSFLGVNGRIPGPTLVVHRGQIIVVDVISELLNEMITIHWHGIRQFNTPWMDGAGIISQCPIAPRNTFRYILNASEAGTFWYHSHNGPQRHEGVFGGLVVKETQGDNDYPIDHEDLPESHTLTLLDWQREEGVNIFWKQAAFLQYYPQVDQCIDRIPKTISSFSFPIPGVDGALFALVEHWSGLINGMGKHPNVAFKNSQLKIFEVEADTTYRFRLIGAQSEYPYKFSVDGHRLLVIATDGISIEPVVADYVIVHTGERYDILLVANQTQQIDYWMRAETLQVNMIQELPPYPFVEGHDARAILHYSGTPPPTPTQYENISFDGYYPKECIEDSLCIAVNCPYQKFHPSYNITCINAHQLRLMFPTSSDLLPSAEYDEQYFFNFGFENQWGTGTINTRSFIFPTVSFHANPDRIDNTTFCDLGVSCSDGCFCTHVVNVPYNKTIRFVFTNRDALVAHPIHLHGYRFHVVGIGYGIYNETTGKLLRSTDEINCQGMAFCTNPSWANITGPLLTIDEFTVQKDTIILPAGGYVVVHFVSNNPGFWPLHCHIDFHERLGMDMLINVAQPRHNPAPEGMQTCGNFTWTVEEFTKAVQFDPDAQLVAQPTDTTENSTESTGSQTNTCKQSEDSDELSSDAVAGISVAGDVFVVLAIFLTAVLLYLALTRKKGVPNYSKGNIELSTTTSAATYVNPARAD